MKSQKNFPYLSNFPGIRKKEKERVMNNLAATFMENLIFVLEFLGLVAAMVIIAYVVEKLEKKKNGVKERTPHYQKDCHDRRLFCDSGSPSRDGFSHPLCPRLL